MNNYFVVDLGDKTLLALMAAILLADRGDVHYKETLELATKVLEATVYHIIVETKTHDQSK